MAIPVETLSAELDRYLTELTRQGWEIVNRSTTSAQIRRRGGGSIGCGFFLFCLLPLAGGFLLHPIFYGFAVLGLLVVGLGIALRKDELRYITESELADRITARLPSAPPP